MLTTRWMQTAGLLGVVVGLVSLLPGCGGKPSQESEAATPPTRAEVQAVRTAAAIAETAAAARTAVETESVRTAAAITETAAAVKTDAEKTVATVRTQAEAVTQAELQTAAAAVNFDAKVAKIKEIIAQRDYQTALTEIQQHLNLPGLTDEQKTTLNTLLETVRQAMASDAARQAAGKLGDALKGFGK